MRVEVVDVGENSEGGAIGGGESKGYDDEVSSEMAFLGGGLSA